ncbi:MAG TPA: exodeoxyribonuclease VII small subunit [Coriobacteriia bacterium]|nr:exodeoxyribonuclease VII small subunit [Coriobacteriia bacterium]
MPEDSYSFAQARLRLEEIVSQVRKKDVSLEKSLDLLEEGVRLANQCTELIDHADWEAGGAPQSEDLAATEDSAGFDSASTVDGVEEGGNPDAGASGTEAGAAS